MAKVLLVEDDNNLREIYEARLVAEGYDIASARDGEEALVVAKKEMPDLVISDVMMPKISGFEMLDIMRNTEGLQQVKVIMLTALGQTEDQSRADSLGADRYLVKSQVTLEDIVNTAHDLLIEAGAESAPAAAPSEPAPITPTPVAAPVAAAPTPAPNPTPVPVPVEPVASTVIPLATAPPELPEDMPPTSSSMPPTPVSTIPVDDLASASAAAEPVVAPAVDTPTQSDDQQTNDQESALVEQQIEDFVATQSGQPEVEAPVAVEPAAEPTAEAEPVTTTPEQEQALNDAVENLSGGLVANETIAPAAEESQSHGRVVIPITHSDALDQTTSSLADLEAAEEATAAAPAPEAEPVAIEPVPAEPLPTPIEPVATTSAGEQPAPAQAPAAPVKAPAPNDEFDPNSIAL